MKATLITGASGGIGEVFARRLAAEKHNLVLVARSEDKLHELCDELMLKHQITAHYVALDLSAKDSEKRLFDETENHGFEIDWLINNAGFGSMGDFAKLDFEREVSMIDLNIRALVALTHLYLQKMRARKNGVIINVASTASFQPVPYMATYAATKAFVRSFSEAVAEENRLFGITVSALCPGPTETNFAAVAGSESFAPKGMETPESVVETALAGVRSGQTQVISGWRNYVGARLVNIIPDFLITRVVGSVMRPKIENRQMKNQVK